MNEELNAREVELNNKLKTLAEEMGFDVREKSEALEQEEFEDLVYHIALEQIKRSSSELWLSDKETQRLTHKANINDAVKILEYWDTYKEK